MGLDLADLLLARKIRKILQENNEIQKQQLEVLGEIKNCLQKLTLNQKD